MYSNKLLVVRNKNTLNAVAEEYMLYLGASTDRDLTGQGLGTKFVGIRSAVDGLKFGRASWDKNGCYLAWYEIEPVQFGDGSNRERAVLVVKRPTGTKRFPMTVDTNLVLSGWTRHPMGNAFPTIREAILDAADEDPHFKIAKAEEMTYSPHGETWTFVEETKELADLMEVPTYYFHHADDIEWLTRNVGVGTVSSVNEAQIFVTAGEKPTIAYAAWTSGRDPKDAVPNPVYDYVLRESGDQKWASMPKRLLEDASSARRTITEALMRTDNVDVLAKVLNSVVNGGWEADLPWSSNEYYWGSTNTVRAAFDKVVQGRPIHNTNEDNLFDMAKRMGKRPVALPQWMYDVCKKQLGFETVHNALDLREKGEVQIVHLDANQRNRLMGALEYLETHYPWQNWRSHVYMSAVTDKGSRLRGLHIPSPQDRIVINFAHPDMDSDREIAKTIVHEMAHHELKQNSVNVNYHYDEFSAAIIELLTPTQGW